MCTIHPLTKPLRNLGAGKMKQVGICTVMEKCIYWCINVHPSYPDAMAFPLCVDIVVISVTLCVDSHQCEMPCERKPMRYGHSEGHTDVTFDDAGK